MENEAFKQQLTAAPIARYKAFLNAATSTKKVWIIGFSNGDVLTLGVGDKSALAVFPDREAAQVYFTQCELTTNPEAKVMDLTLYDFTNFCIAEAQRAEPTAIGVFPNGVDVWLVSAEEMAHNIQEKMKLAH